MIDTPLLLPDAQATDAAGRALGGVLRAGDVIALSGDLGAGKTSLGKRLSKIFNLLLRLKRL